jgi:uncharacterized iron-regulated membrane protein
MTAHSVVLKLHLWLGAGAAIFLVILGLTGSVTAFENDIEHWLHPGLYYVQVRPQVLPEAELIQTVQQRFAPARVVVAHIFRQPDLAHVMQLNDRSTVLVSQYDGHILGRITGPSTTQKIVGYIHQLHTHLVTDPRSAPKAAKIGAVIVQIVGFMLCLLVLLGLILWWRTKRAAIKWNAPWFRIFFDAHHAIGIYSALFLFTAALTGVLVERGDLIVRLTHSPEPLRFPQLQSSVAAGATPISVDRAEQIALAVIPGTTVTDIQLPLNPKSVFIVVLRVPEETSEAAHSYIFIDQYSGMVLHAINFLTESPGYRVIRFNRSIHTGDVWGTPGHILVSTSSLMLVVMVVTGLVIWLKKLAL